MDIEVGHDALEGARAVENAGAKPRSVGPHAHDRRVAAMPIAPEKGPGLACCLHGQRPLCTKHTAKSCVELTRGTPFPRADFTGAFRNEAARPGVMLASSFARGVWVSRPE